MSLDPLKQVSALCGACVISLASFVILGSYPATSEALLHFVSSASAEAVQTSSTIGPEIDSPRFNVYRIYDNGGEVTLIIEGSASGQVYADIALTPFFSNGRQGPVQNHTNMYLGDKTTSHFTYSSSVFPLAPGIKKLVMAVTRIKVGYYETAMQSAVTIERSNPAGENLRHYGYAVHDRGQFKEHIDRIKDYTNLLFYAPTAEHGVPLSSKDQVIRRDELLYAIHSGLDKIVIGFMGQMSLLGYGDGAAEQANVQRLRETIRGYEDKVYAIFVWDEPGVHGIPSEIEQEELRRRVDLIKRELPGIPVMINYAPLNHIPLTQEYFPNDLDIIAMDNYPCASNDAGREIRENLDRLRQFAKGRPILFLARAFYMEGTPKECTPTGALTELNVRIAESGGAPLEGIIWWFWDRAILVEAPAYGAVNYPDALSEQREIGKGLLAEGDRPDMSKPLDAAAHISSNEYVIKQGRRLFNFDLEDGWVGSFALNPDINALLVLDGDLIAADRTGHLIRYGADGIPRGTADMREFWNTPDQPDPLDVGDREIVAGRLVVISRGRLYITPLDNLVKFEVFELSEVFPQISAAGKAIVALVRSGEDRIAAVAEDWTVETVPLPSSQDSRAPETGSSSSSRAENETLRFRHDVK